MKNWIIEKVGPIHKYLIVSEKSIWITDQFQAHDINELIENKKLGKVKSFRYDLLKEITLIESNFTIKFKFKDKDEDISEYKIDKSIFGEIRSYLKLNLAGIQVKNYSVFKQILPQLSVIVFVIIFFLLIYQTAVDLDSGMVFPESRKRGIIKQIIYNLANLLGVYGTIGIGSFSILGLLFFINKKIQNPKKGEVLVFRKFVSLKNQQSKTS